MNSIIGSYVILNFSALSLIRGVSSSKSDLKAHKMGYLK